MLQPLLFLLLSAASWSQTAAHDSVIINSPRRDNTFLRCHISDSDLSGCKIHRSGLQSTSGKGSVIAYSFLAKSICVDSVLDATYPDPKLDATSTTDVFQNIDGYFLNRVVDSELLSARIDASPQCYSSDRGFNSSIYHSRIFHSTIRRSRVFQSNFTESSSSCLSVIGFSDLHYTRVSNSLIQKLKSYSCTMSNSVAEHTHCEGSTVSNSEIKACSVFNSNLVNSFISGNSEATNTTLTNSEARNSNLVGSELTNSKVFNSKLTNCVIVNSNVDNKVWDSVNMMNGMMMSGDRNIKEPNFLFPMLQNFFRFH